MRAWGVVLIALLAAGCGGGPKESVPKQPPPALAQRCGDDATGVKAKQVWFRASDGALLDGAEVGDGDVGVVLAHESPSDLCPWLPFAKTLAGKGYRAFVFDFRGSGASPAQFGAKASKNDLDVVAAAAKVCDLGAKKVFLVGGSFGGAAVLVAAPEVKPRPAGVISLSGEPQLLGALRAAARIDAPLLVLIARNDYYSSVADNRRLVRAAASMDKRLVVYPEDWHGWDLLYHAPYKARVSALVFDFLRDHSADG